MSKPSSSYVPIACDYVDYIEHLATKKQEVTIMYMDELKVCVSLKDCVTTWKTESGEEFLYTDKGLKIRLDQLLAINGIKPGDSCKF